MESDELKSMNLLLQEQLDAVRQTTDEMKDQLSIASRISQNAEVTQSSIRSITLLNKQLVDLNRVLVTDEITRNSLLRDKKDIMKDILKSSSIEKGILAEINELEDKQNQGGISNKGKRKLQAVIESLSSQLDFNQSINESLEVELDLTNRVNKSLGLTGGIAEGIKKSLSKLGLGKLSDQLGIDDAVDKTREYTANLVAGQRNAGQTGVSLGNNFKSAIELVKNLGKNLLKSLGPAYILLELVGALLDMDKSSENIAKSFGISYRNAVSINAELNGVARSSDNIWISSKGINEAFIELNSALGTNTMLGSDMLINFEEITKQIGYSKETAIALYKLRQLTGRDEKDVAKTYLGQVKILNIRNGLSINEKSILNDISNISKSLLVTFSKNPKELAKASFEAKKLGLNLKTVEDIAKSFLDIESSISKEFEAEVLTGRSLNLERARYYALTNDIAGLSKEIGNQGVTSVEFAKMNRIQQDAIASALGMSRDEMAGMLLDGEVIRKVGAQDLDGLKEKFEVAKKTGKLKEFEAELGNKAYMDQLKSNSAQSSFQQMLTKLQDIFVQIAEPLMPLLDVFIEIAEIIGPIGKLVSTVLVPPLRIVSAIIQSVSDGLSGVIKLLKAPMNWIQGKDSGLGNGVFNFDKSDEKWQKVRDIPGDTMDGISSIGNKQNSSQRSIQDGVIDNKGNINVSTPKGQISLDDEDSFVGNKNGIIAGTNLGGGEGNITKLTSSLNNKLDQLIGEVRIMTKELQRGMTVNLDGNKISNELMTPMALNMRNI